MLAPEILALFITLGSQGSYIYASKTVPMPHAPLVSDFLQVVRLYNDGKTECNPKLQATDFYKAIAEWSRERLYSNDERRVIIGAIETCIAQVDLIS